MGDCNGWWQATAMTRRIPTQGRMAFYSQGRAASTGRIAERQKTASVAERSVPMYTYPQAASQACPQAVVATPVAYTIEPRPGVEKLLAMDR